MDRTITSPGEIELYRILRLPEHDEARLVERDRVITEFQATPARGKNCNSFWTGSAASIHAPGMTSFLWMPPQPRPLLWRLCTLLAFMAYSSIIASVLAYAAGSNLLSAAFGMIVLSLPGQHGRAFHRQAPLRSRHAVARYLGACIATARRIAMIDHPGLDVRLTELARQRMTCRFWTGCPRRSMSSTSKVGRPGGPSLRLPGHPGAPKTQNDSDP